MSKKIEVKEIRIKIGNDEIGLSVEQALELKDILVNMLKDDDTRPVYVPCPYPYPITYVPSSPYWYIKWDGNTTYTVSASTAPATSATYLNPTGGMVTPT